MKKHSLLIIVTLSLILAVMQTSFFAYLLGVKLSPHFIAGLCLAFLLRQKYKHAYVSAVLGGLFVDLLGTNLIGVTPLSLTLYVYLYKWLHTFYLRNNISKIIFSIISFYIIRMVALTAFTFDFRLLLGVILTILVGYIFSILLAGTNTSEQKINY